MYSVLVQSNYSDNVHVNCNAKMYLLVNILASNNHDHMFIHNYNKLHNAIGS